MTLGGFNRNWYRPGFEPRSAASNSCESSSLSSSAILGRLGIWKAKLIRNQSVVKDLSVRLRRLPPLIPVVKGTARRSRRAGEPSSILGAGAIQRRRTVQVTTRSVKPLATPIRPRWVRVPHPAPIEVERELPPRSGR